jgi:diadenylate cyclase
VSAVATLRFLSVDWRDLFEIAVTAFVIYRLLRLFRGTRALQMIVGIVVLVVVYAAAWVFKLTMITYLLGLVFTYGAFALLVLFQPELRATLAHLGQSRVMRMFRGERTGAVALDLAEAVATLGRARLGALLVIERGVRLGEYARTGTPLLARVNGDLLQAIFTPPSPLHDGAVIIRGDTIVGAGCILPLSQAELGDRSLGTRHRAAIGLSEQTDALAIVVSEESGQVSVAEHGRLRRGVPETELRSLLEGVTPRVTAEQAAVSLRA